MSITAELRGATTTPCKLCAFIQTLAPEDAAEFRENLQQPTSVVGNTAVVSFLKRRRVDVNETSVRRHRSNHEHHE